MRKLIIENSIMVLSDRQNRLRIVAVRLIVELIHNDNIQARDYKNVVDAPAP